MLRAAFFVLVLAATARADLQTTFSLQPVGTPGAAAQFDVALAVSGSSVGGTVEVVQLGVSGSSSALTAGNTDFSRFSFAIDPALTGWAELAPIGATGLGLLAPLDPIVGPFITGPGTTALGRLTVDLTGLPAGNYAVSLTGGPAGFSSDAGGTVDGNLVGAFSAADPTVAGVAFAEPSGVSFSSNGGTPAPVPAPAGVVLIAVAGFALAARRRFTSVSGGVRTASR